MNWIVRGDTEGYYNLTADYSAQLQPFGDPVSIEATTESPLHVWGGSAVTMTVDADATATANYPYNIRVGLTNVSDVPVYNPAVTLYQEGGINYIFQPKQQGTYSAAVIEPGQTFYTPYYVLIPQVTGYLDLSHAFVQQTGGNVSLKSTIVDHPTVDPPETAPTLTTTGAPHAVDLTWQTVPGATSYQIFSTPAQLTPFGTTPSAVVPAIPGSGHAELVRHGCRSIGTSVVCCEFRHQRGGDHGAPVDRGPGNGRLSPACDGAVHLEQWMQWPGCHRHGVDHRLALRHSPERSPSDRLELHRGLPAGRAGSDHRRRRVADGVLRREQQGHPSSGGAGLGPGIGLLRHWNGNHCHTRGLPEDHEYGHDRRRGQSHHRGPRVRLRNGGSVRSWIPDKWKYQLPAGGGHEQGLDRRGLQRRPA